MTRVRLQSLTKDYAPGIRAVEDVSLDIPSGELLVLLGPSGSGKTTLLRLIAGLEQPTSGEVYLDDQRMTHLPPHRRGIGMVFQRAVLYPHLNVRDNLLFGLGRSAEDKRRAEEMAALLGLEGHLIRMPGELSGGEQQRVALGRALVRRPGVLLLDEPLASLDGPLRWELRQQLHLLCRLLRATMIHVTHEQDEALGLADRIAVLNRGRCVQLGSPAELLTCPASVFVARLLGWPPINLLSGTLRFEAEQLLLAGEQANLVVPSRWKEFAGRDVVLGLRPQQVQPCEGGSSTGTRVTLIAADVQPASGSDQAFLCHGGWSLISLGRRCEPSTKVPVSLDLDQALLFDAKTGELLRQES